MLYSTVVYIPNSETSCDGFVATSGNGDGTVVTPGDGTVVTEVNGSKNSELSSGGVGTRVLWQSLLEMQFNHTAMYTQSSFTCNENHVMALVVKISLLIIKVQNLRSDPD